MEQKVTEETKELWGRSLFVRFVSFCSIVSIRVIRSIRGWSSAAIRAIREIRGFLSGKSSRAAKKNNVCITDDTRIADRIHPWKSVFHPWLTLPDWK